MEICWNRKIETIYRLEWRAIYSLGGKTNDSGRVNAPKNLHKEKNRQF